LLPVADLSDIGRAWSELDTPRLLIDEERLAQNIERFQREIANHGVALRSHIKTHKIPEIARLQVEAGAVGIAAAKVSEAEVFVDAGIRDVVIAYPVFGDHKWRRMARLARHARVTCHVENAAAISGLAVAARAEAVTLHVRIELDLGLHRSGVSPEEAVELANVVLSHESLHFDGVTAHRSIVFDGAAGRDISELSAEEGRLIVAGAEVLRRAGIEVPNVVAGSTPTAAGVAGVPGITEVVAGTYVFYDRGMAERGVCSQDDIALSIAATVVSCSRPGRYTVDAGSKTFTKDTYPGGTATRYGAHEDGGDMVVGLSEEHGIVATDAQLPPIGAVRRFHPMHVCPVLNLADDVAVLRDGAIVDVWRVAARGMNR
jgi:D-serine deaminase-like pyridoxal phosphate-dependent protein